MKSKSRARKIVLPSLVLTELASNEDPLGREIKFSKCIEGVQKYFIRPVTYESSNSSNENMEGCQYAVFPMVVNCDGQPWAEACLWILSIFTQRGNIQRFSCGSVADDMAAYLQFIEEKGIDWANFPTQKIFRPTYRFNAYLKGMIENKEIGRRTAKRRMGTVIRFYRWLISEDIFEPKNPPWKEDDRYIEFKGRYGDSLSKVVKTTDVSIRISEQDNPYDEFIYDGGKLRPLTCPVPDD